MSLKTLFMLMGLVTSAMIAAVIYTKVLRAPADRTLTVGEQRTIDRICDVRCTDRAPEFAKKASNSEELANMARACVAECRVHYLRSAP